MSQFCLLNIWLILYKQSLVTNLIRSGWGPCATLETSSTLINTIVTKLQFLHINNLPLPPATGDNNLGGRICSIPELNKENSIINTVSDFQKNSFKPVEHMEPSPFNGIGWNKLFSMQNEHLMSPNMWELRHKKLAIKASLDFSKNSTWKLREAWHSRSLYRFTGRFTRHTRGT